jgi:endonuclease YncB( thermonuclease family)
MVAATTTPKKKNTTKPMGAKARSFLNQVAETVESKSKTAATEELFTGQKQEEAPVAPVAAPSVTEEMAKKGLQCWAWIEEHSKYYRARITEVVEPGKYNVIYRDFKATVGLDDLQLEKPSNLKAKA